MAAAKMNAAISPRVIKTAQIRFNKRSKFLFDTETRFGG
jgi:hypothetical protein